MIHKKSPAKLIAELCGYLPLALNVAGKAIAEHHDLAPEEYIKERLDNQIDWYDKKSVKSQKWFKRLQLIVIVSSATIPFLSGYMDETTLFLKSYMVLN